MAGTSIAALTELLKFLYNLSFHVTLNDEAGSTCVPTISGQLMLMFRLAKPLIQLIFAASSQEFESPYTNAVHCCLNLNLESAKSQLFPEPSPTNLVEKLVEILDKQIPGDTESINDRTLDSNLAPVVVFLTNIQGVSPDQVKTYLKTKLLPSESYLPSSTQSNLILETVRRPSVMEKNSQPVSSV